MSAYEHRPCSRTVRRLVRIGALPSGVRHTAREIQIARDRIAQGIDSLVDRSYFKGQHGRPTNREGWEEWLRLAAKAQHGTPHGLSYAFGGL